MSLHKLTAGSGYDYLTRQVAALDATDKGRTGLASYYTERGESPGVWVGSGMEGIDGLDVGDPVTAEQMCALFGCGLHPLAELRLQQLEGPDFIGQDFRDVMRLGAPFKIIDDATPFDAYLREHVFLPAGMSASLTTYTDDEPVAGLAGGHVIAYGHPIPAPAPATFDAGAGGVISTAADMAHWLVVQTNGGCTAEGGVQTWVWSC